MRRKKGSAWTTFVIEFRDTTWTQRSLMALGLLIVFGCTVFLAIGPALFRSDLRYRRDSYSVSKGHAVTSCIVKNHGRAVAKEALMSVVFLSKILDVSISPESAGKVVETATDQFSAMIELENIAPGSEVTVSFSVEKPQNEPFEVRLLDMTDGRPLRERAKP